MNFTTRTNDMKINVQCFPIQWRNVQLGLGPSCRSMLFKEIQLKGRLMLRCLARANGNTHTARSGTHRVGELHDGYIRKGHSFAFFVTMLVLLLGGRRHVCIELRLSLKKIQRDCTVADAYRKERSVCSALWNDG